MIPGHSYRSGRARKAKSPSIPSEAHVRHWRKLSAKARAVALPGSVCRWHGEGEPVEIHESKLRGVASYGLPDCLRITVGAADQNRAVIDALSEFAAR